MKPEIKELWLAELRSGKRTQGQGALRTRSGRECCLGVLCDIAVGRGIGRWEYDEGSNAQRFVSLDDPDDWAVGVLPESVQDWAGVNSSDPFVIDVVGARLRLSVRNDRGLTFAEIADMIERYL